MKLCDAILSSYAERSADGDFRVVWEQSVDETQSSLRKVQKPPGSPKGYEILLYMHPAWLSAVEHDI